MGSGMANRAHRLEIWPALDLLRRPVTLFPGCSAGGQTVLYVTAKESGHHQPLQPLIVLVFLVNL